MKTISFKAAATATILSFAATLAQGQTAPEGVCQFFADPDYAGQGGQYSSGQGAYLSAEGEVPAALMESNTLGDYTMYNSPELAASLSSVRVGPGCMAGWVTPSGSEYGFTETTEDYANFASNTNDQAVAVYCGCE